MQLSFPSKLGVIQTIRAAADRLQIPTQTASGAQSWGGHALRRGGAQFLATRGIDIHRIQALARHSSNAILLYLDGVHAQHLGNLALQATSSTSTSAPAIATAPVAARPPAGPEPTPTQDGLYVTSARGNSKCHLIDTNRSTHTLCNWAWSPLTSHRLQSPQGQMCARCTRAAVIRAGGSSSSESS